jgi:hypothetical protein
MATRMQQRRGTAAQWTAANPILAAGEIGFETDTSRFKMGNGSSNWASLTYFSNTAELSALLDGAPDALNTLNELAAALGDDPAFFTNILADVETAEDNANTFTTGAVNTHAQITTNIHGIANTALLATTTTVSDAVATAATDATTKANAAQTAAEATAASALSLHSDDTTLVHGIADTSLLATTAATQSYSDTSITTHNNDTTSVHGIADTSLLATTAETQSYSDTSITTHNNDTTSVHGIADTSILVTTTGSQTLTNKTITSPTGLVKADVGLNNVDNTSDANKPVSTATQAALDLKAPLADPTFTGTVSGVTKAHVGLGNVDNTADASKPVSTAQSTAIATAKAEAIADATSQVNALLSGAPAALNTLDELAAALGDDANFAASVTTNLGLKVDSLTPISQKTSSYTLSSLTERDDLIEMGSASALTLTIPTDATLNFPIGTSIDILQTGAGQVTIAPVSGTVTVNATPGLKLRTTWSSCTLLKRAANTWVVFGDLSA